MAAPTEVFIDTDVALDHLADRRPFSEYAHRIFALAETGEVSARISALSFSNLYYILRKVAGAEEAILLLKNLSRLVKVAPVLEQHVREALDSKFADFEDAVQYFSAKQNPTLKCIVTRNTKHYRLSELKVISSEEFVRTYKSEIET